MLCFRGSDPSCYLFRCGGDLRCVDVAYPSCLEAGRRSQANLKPIDILSQEERTALAVDQPDDRARIMNVFDVWAGQAVLTHTHAHTQSSSR